MSAAIIKKRKREASLLEEKATSLEKTLDSFDNPVPSNNIELVKVLLGSFLNAEAKYSAIAEELISLDEESADAFDEKRRIFVSRACIILARANTLLKAAEGPSVSSATAPILARLPEIEIPKFHGGYDEWTTFYDTFVALIHENPSLSNVHRFYYLLGAVSGEPSTLIRAVQMSDRGYDIAWARLKQRYQNERFIVKRHVQTILHMPVPKKEHYQSLRKLTDTLALQIASLKALGRPVDHWDDLLIEIVAEKLDVPMQREWEGRFCSTIPTIADLESFLSIRCNQLEAMQDRASMPSEQGRPRALAVQRSAPSRISAAKPTLMLPTSSAPTPSIRPCAICDALHPTRMCEALIKASVAERIKIVKAKNLCFNCLRVGHKAPECRSSFSCFTCQQRHHSLLHKPSSAAMVAVLDNDGIKQQVRALLDCGSEVSMITAACARRLGLPIKTCNAPLILAGGSLSAAPGVTCCEMSSLTSEYAVSLDAYVMPAITTPTPSRHLDGRALPQVALADPSFNVPGKIDMLLGSGLFLSLLTDGRHKVGQLVLQNTQLGWILGGELPSTPHQPHHAGSAVGHAKLSEVVARFWEIEGYDTSVLPPADRACESHFRNHVDRNRAGRFVVALLFKESPDRLGNSSATARGPFLSLEKRLLRHPEVHEKYKAFMQEYIDLGHMRLHHDDVHNGYYLPHHCVIKEASLTTKLPVVFNASAPSSTGVSLNDLLWTGPKQQDEFFIIMMRMRYHQFGITADVTKMYRQVLMRSEDTRYERIWWRTDPSDQLKSYELDTVTYGTAPASYLAIKAHRETAATAAQQYPVGADKCLTDFYVNYLFTGADTENELAIIRDQVQATLATGSFHLNKWASNSSSVLAHVNQEDRRTDVIIHDWAATINALGMQWNPKDDVLSYKIGAASANPRTKRSMLSEICKIFDPLGIIGPVVITAKILMQTLWKTNCGWDEVLPEECHTTWSNYHQFLSYLPQLSISRKVRPTSAALGQHIELHGYADASECAYGACIYVVIIQNTVRVSYELLCAKSRVAPIRAISIPRLELAAALLLAELMKCASDAMSVGISRKLYFSDSSVVLTWIRAESQNFKVFVANRICEIQRLTSAGDWFHVATTDNPADLLSRGLTTVELMRPTLWWHGPNVDLTNVTRPVSNLSPHLELKCSAVKGLVEVTPQCSSYRKTVRVWAQCVKHSRDDINHSSVNVPFFYFP